MTEPRHDLPPASQRGLDGHAGSASTQAGSVAGLAAGQVFDPEELQALGVAFERSIEAVAPPPWAERQPGAEHYAKETVAKVILGVARSGERDPEVITAATVDRLTI